MIYQWGFVAYSSMIVGEMWRKCVNNYLLQSEKKWGKMWKASFTIFSTFEEDFLCSIYHIQLWKNYGEGNPFHIIVFGLQNWYIFELNKIIPARSLRIWKSSSFAHTVVVVVEHNSYLLHSTVWKLSIFNHTKYQSNWFVYQNRFSWSKCS